MLAFETCHYCFVVDFGKFVVLKLMSEVFGHFIEVDADFSWCRFFNVKQLILEFNET